MSREPVAELPVLERGIPARSPASGILSEDDSATALDDREPSPDLADMQQDLLADLYNDDLLNDCYQKLLDGVVSATMDQLVAGLDERRRNSSVLEWQGFVQLCRLHPICELLYQDPFLCRAYKKPRGYAGDAELLDFLYGLDEGHAAPADTTALGRELFDYSIRWPLAEGARARARLIAETVDRLALEIPRPRVLSVASGHLREAGLTGALRQRRIGSWVALDSDTDSLQEVQRCYARHGVETVAASVRQLLVKRLALGEFDFIYSTGLYDYLQQTTAKRLTERLFEMLRPGGQLLVANFITGVQGQGTMESLMDWHLVYRTLPEMLDLAMGVEQPQVKDIRLHVGTPRVIVYLLVTKKLDEDLQDSPAEDWIGHRGPYEVVHHESRRAI